MNRIKYILFFLTIALAAMAEEVSFQASAPAQVIVGKPFQITYTVNQRSKDLRPPQFESFDVIAGPYSSQSQSTEWINGQRTTSFSQTYTYTLMAQKAGTFNLQPATITVGRQQYTSNGLKITVLPPDDTPQTQTQQSQQSADQTSDNIFIRTIVSKSKVYEQECILLTYKLYFAGVEITQITNNTQLPEFKGFLKQDIEQSEIQTQLEHYNGRNYQTAVLYQTLLYPQRSGEIEIDPASYEVILRVQTRSQVRSIFDDFFGSYTNVARTIKSRGVKINVQPLPKGKPANFSGGVGQFTLNSSISKQEVTANEAVTLQLNIKGNGNLKLLKTPAFDFPEGFEEYDPKVTNNFKNTTAGMSGTKQIEYLFIPRAAGDYTIPALTLSYFDPQDAKYKTLTTPEYNLHVNRGQGEAANTNIANYVNKEDIKQFGTDIRYIYTGKPTVAKKPILKFNSLNYWLCFLLPLLLSVCLFIVFRRRIKENADIQRVKYKKANKVAQKRLKKAKQLLKENNKEAFYEEIERAALSYMSDRLRIPTANLNRDNIKSELQKKNVSEQLIAEVEQVLATAAFARYAPAQTDDEMQQLYEQTSQLIDKLENQRI